MSYSIRAADVEDAPGIARVHVEGWQWAYRGVLHDDFLQRLSVDERARRWERVITQSPPGSVIVAASSGEIVGFVSVGDPEHPADRGPGRYEVYAIYLLEEHTGRGVGRDLMLAAEERMSAMGGTEAILWVLQENAISRKFYESGGWVADGATRLHPVAGEDHTVVRYRKAL